MGEETVFNRVEGAARFFYNLRKNPEKKEGPMAASDWKSRIRGQGYRMTLPRQAVLDVLTRTAKHLTAKEIYLQAHRQCPSCGMTTIYRTLELLVQMGVVMKFDFGEGKSRYELTEEHSRKAHHHHLICRKCKTVIDYTEFVKDEKDFLLKIEKALAKKYAFEIDGHEISFKGVCRNCR